MKQTSVQQSILDISPQLTFKDVLKKFVLYFPIGLLLLFSLIAFLLQIKYRQDLAVQREEQLNRLHLVHYLVKNDLETLASDLLILANNEALQNFLQNDSNLNKSEAQNRFLLFVRDRKIYDQARFLDVEGNEIIRVNMEKVPELVAGKDLQNKKERYYFSETLHLDKDKIFVSPLDLNIENGEIEQPHLPVIRVGTPVYDQKNRLRGIVLINFYAEHILNHYSRAYSSDEKTSFSIVNRAGYWLKADNPELELGFMLGNDNRLQNQEPLLWKRIQDLNNGQVRLPSGLHTFRTIYPGELIRSDISSSENFEGKEPTSSPPPLTWHFIVSIPKEYLSYQNFLDQHPELYWILTLVFLLLIGAVFHLANVRIRKQHFERTQTLLTTSIEQSPAAMLISTPDGEIKYVNPKFEKMSGYSREELIGGNPRILKSGATASEVYEALWKTVLKGLVWHGNFENRRKDGSSYFVSAQIAPLIGPKNKINNLLAIQEDITEKKALQDQLEKMATRDSLTGILNRGQFLHLANKELHKLNRYESSAAILIFDLDFFKNVNDTHGHDAGDTVLIKFVESLQDGLRDSDLLGRLGGEEFAALVLETDQQDTFQLAERLREATEKMVVNVDMNEIKITTSIGFTLLYKEDKDVSSSLKRADNALYIAKEKGRNRTEYLE